LKRVESETRKKLAEYEGAIMKKKEELLEATRSNTRLVAATSDLDFDKRTLEKSLNEALKMPEDRTADRRQEEAEQRQLVQLVRMQASEIETLRQEIMRLVRKDGHLAPPAAQATTERLPPVKARM
jgi:hypothetical protein